MRTGVSGKCRVCLRDCKGMLCMTNSGCRTAFYKTHPVTVVAAAAGGERKREREVVDLMPPPPSQQSLAFNGDDKVGLAREVGLVKRPNLDAAILKESGHRWVDALVGAGDRDATLLQCCGN